MTEKPVEYADGVKRLRIDATNGKTGEKVTMPGVENAQRRMGRFKVEVKRVTPEAAAVELYISAEVDLSVRGRDAFVESEYLKGNDTLDVFLNRLSEKYGFEVEWVEKPAGSPESIQYVKSLQLKYSSSSRFKGILKDLTKTLKMYAWPKTSHNSNRILNDQVEFEWKDATHLRVWSKEYETILANQEASAQRAEEYKRQEAKHAEESENEREKFREVFDKQYTLLTQVYALRYIAPATALTVAEPELKFYYLLPLEEIYRELGKQMVFRSNAPLALATKYGLDSVEKGEHYGIFSGGAHKEADESIKQALGSAFAVKEKSGSIREMAIADDRSGALIVVARAATHEKIEKAIARMDQIVAEEPARGPLERYRLEVILLQGHKAGEVAATGEGRPLSFRVDGHVETLAVRPGARVAKGDVIARLDDREQQREIQKLKLEVQNIHLLLADLEATLKIAKEQHAVGVIPAAELVKAQAPLREQQNKLDQAQLALVSAEEQLARYTLKAPAAGSIGAVPVRINQGVKAGETIAILVSEDDAAEGARLSFRQTGILTSLPVKSGAAVKAGDVLARLDDSDLEIALKIAQAKLEAAKVRVDQAQKAWEMSEKLFHKKLIDEMSYLEKKSKVTESSAALQLAEIEYEGAAIEIKRYTLKAPHAGRVSALLAHEGEHVRAEQTILVLATEEKGQATTPSLDELHPRNNVVRFSEKLFGLDKYDMAYRDGRMLINATYQQFSSGNLEAARREMPRIPGVDGLFFNIDRLSLSKQEDVLSVYFSEGDRQAPAGDPQAGVLDFHPKKQLIQLKGAYYRIENYSRKKASDGRETIEVNYRAVGERKPTVDNTPEIPGVENLRFVVESIKTIGEDALQVRYTTREPDSAARGAAPDLAAELQISKEDLALFEIASLTQLGRGVIEVLAERGELGQAQLALTDVYSCGVKFQDVRQPYVIVKGSLLGPARPGQTEEKTLLENTLFLEPDKPAILGLTNMRQALILVLRLRGKVTTPAPTKQAAPPTIDLPGGPASPPEPPLPAAKAPVGAAAP